MKQAIRQIACCALALLLFCVLCRLFLFRTYTVHIRIQPFLESAAEAGDPIRKMEIDDPQVAHLGSAVWNEEYMSVPVHPEGKGKTDILVYDADGRNTQMYMLGVGRFGTVYDFQTGGFTGDTAVLIATTLFWLAVSAIMLWHYLQAKGPAFYAYSTIYFAGFSLFALVTGLLMLRVTLSHMLHPVDFSMYSVYGVINGASKQFMMLTMPVMVIFAIAMAVSNLALLQHARAKLQNVLGLAVSLLLILGEVIGFLLFFCDFSGSEWEGRLQSTLENVYATVFVYFECMLVGSAICGLTAARHQPEMNKDFIVILGCWFQKDGSLPPLLKGRVDRAVSFWKAQKERTGKEALLIPSGGQGRDESMPEAEAMRRYLLTQGIPEESIQAETRSKNTYQNMAFSKQIADAVNKNGKAVFATTNYHVFRSGLWANLAGFPAEGMGGKTVWWFWPNAFMRECMGLLRNRWKQEIVLLFVLMAFFGILSIILG